MFIRVRMAACIFRCSDSQPLDGDTKCGRFGNWGAAPYDARPAAVRRHGEGARLRGRENAARPRGRRSRRREPCPNALRCAVAGGGGRLALPHDSGRIARRGASSALRLLALSSSRNGPAGRIRDRKKIHSLECVTTPDKRQGAFRGDDYPPSL